ncbi:MAG: Ni/Fe hydrogenase subunit alpha [Calditrichaeota bacterium]|nr:MAG: Ni/Fe hydrogenase subunit alpha [Calditrichota bacterium]
MKKLDINVHHLTRVEGHGNVVVNYEKGKVENFQLQIVESPRFFEVMLQGRHITEAPHITGRICGICSVGHTTASLKAAEKALGITPSEQTQEMRKVLLNAEFIQSHVLHACFLVLPDFLNVGSVIPLAETHPEEVKRALRLKKLGNDICEVLVGRHIHPVSMTVNGFTRIPSESEFEKVRKMLLDSEDDILKMVALFKTLKMPDFVNDTENIGLTSDGEEFCLYDGKITSSYGKIIEDENDYLELIKERVVEHSSAKHVKGEGETYAVGALSRLNLSAEKLHPKAKVLVEEFGLELPNYNPFNNNVAQVIETVHCFYDSIERIENLLEKGIKQENYKDYEVKAGRGAGACEVPRGILFHDYEIDEKGIIVKANCIIPTGQNLANIEKNMRKLVPEIIDKPKEEITHSLEMLVRAYDPCISCSAHFLDVEFV